MAATEAAPEAAQPSCAAATAGSSGVAARLAAAAAAAAVAAPPLPSPARDDSLPWPAREDCLYCSCYCEENIYKLGQALAPRLQQAAAWVVFVSNAHKAVPLWCQRAAARPSSPTLWDYHVLLLVQPSPGQPALVLDLDSTLPFPCSLAEYQRQALLGGDAALPPQYRRWYRVVALPAFLRHFASDRSHMVGEAGAGWMAPPPAWPPIRAPGGAVNTLPAFLDFSRAGAAGGAEEEASVQQRQRQRERHARGPSADDLGGGGRGADEDAPPFGVVLSEPAFLRRFGCQAGDEGD